GYTDSKLKFYKEDIDLDNQFILEEGNLIITMTDLSKKIDTLGFGALVPSDNYTYLHNQRIGLVNIKEGYNEHVSKNYLYWLMRTPNYQKYIANTSTGTTVHHTSPKTVLTYEFNLPPISEQKAIAETLSTLDDKIDNNNKINENLEKQAQSIFKHWFVDFEFPDENGNPYKSSGGEMIESELGMIPKGWEVKKLGSISKIDNKSIKFPNKGLYNHYSIPAFTEKKLPISEDGLTIRSNKYKINNDHILFSRLNPRFKRLWRPICIGNNNVCSTEFLVIKSNENNLRNFLYSIMDSSKFYDFILQNVTGATGSHQRVSPPSVVLEYKLAMPSIELIDRYVAVVNPIYKKKDCNMIASQRLAELRDSLLPKLMSGEIRIPV